MSEQNVVERLRERLDQGFDPDHLVNADELRALLAVVEAAQELDKNGLLPRTTASGAQLVRVRSRAFYGLREALARLYSD